MGSQRKDAIRPDARQTLTQSPAPRPRAAPAAKKSMGTVNITIHGKRLAIRTDHDPKFVQQLSGHVSEKLRELQNMAPSAPFEKLMLLASLTLAEELFEAREQLVGLRHDLAERTEAMLAIIEDETARLGE